MDRTKNDTFFSIWSAIDEAIKSRTDWTERDAGGLEVLSRAALDLWLRCIPNDLSVEPASLIDATPEAPAETGADDGTVPF